MAAPMDYAQPHIRNLGSRPAALTNTGVADSNENGESHQLPRPIPINNDLKKQLSRAPSAADQDEMDTIALAEWFASVSLRTLRGIFKGITETEGYKGPSAIELAERAADWGFDKIHPEHAEPPAVPVPATVPSIYEGEHDA